MKILFKFAPMKHGPDSMFLPFLPAVHIAKISLGLHIRYSSLDVYEMHKTGGLKSSFCNFMNIRSIYPGDDPNSLPSFPFGWNLMADVLSWVESP